MNQASLDLSKGKFLSSPTAINHLLSSWDCLDSQAIIGLCDFCSCSGKIAIARILDGFRSVMDECKDGTHSEGAVLLKLGDWIKVWLDGLADHSTPLSK
jgi:hypothetical protein